MRYYRGIFRGQLLVDCIILMIYLTVLTVPTCIPCFQSYSGRRCLVPVFSWTFRTPGCNVGGKQKSPLQRSWILLLTNQKAVHKFSTIRNNFLRNSGSSTRNPSFQQHETTNAEVTPKNQGYCSPPIKVPVSCSQPYNQNTGILFSTNQRAGNTTSTN